MADTFNGDNAALIRSAEALLRLDAAGALAPHGIGGHARDIITAFIARLDAAGQRQPVGDIVQRLRDTPNWRKETYGSWKDCVSTYDRAPFEAADEIERLSALLATQPPQDERGQEANANPWRDLFWSVARALNCLPSTFVDGNAHVYKQAERYAAIATAPPVALSTLTDEQIDEGMDKSIMSAHEITVFGAGVRWAEKKHRALAASAPAQQTMQTFELLGIVQTAMSQANVIIKAEGDKGDLSQAMKDLPLTLRVIETALSTPPQPVAAEVAKDAARYRFLRMDAGIRNERPFIAISSAGGISQWIGFHADKKIDSAMAGTGSDESAKENGNGL